MEDVEVIFIPSAATQLLLISSLFCPLLSGAIPAFSAVQTQKPSDQSRLTREAEKNGFTVRRVEFCCDLEVRDEVLRKRITLIEGEKFTKAQLERSISRLNSLKLLKPVTLKNVELKLDRENKHVDFTFFLEQ
jgi:Surface antigen variable number repeat